MKKFLAGLTAFVLVFGIGVTFNSRDKQIFSVTACAEDTIITNPDKQGDWQYQYGDWQYTLENDEVGISHYTGDPSKLENNQAITIPSYIDGYPVRKINAFAFKDFVSDKSLRMPDTVVEIGESAFENAKVEGSLLGLRKIGKNAFSKSSIGFATFPTDNSWNLRDIGDYAYLRYGNAESFKGGMYGNCYIPDYVESIGEKAIGYCIDESGKIEKIDGLCIHAAAGTIAESVAKEYAEKNGFKFEYTNYGGYDTNGKTLKEVYNDGDFLDLYKFWYQGDKDHIIVEDGIYYLLYDKNEGGPEPCAIVIGIDEDKTEAIIPKEINGYRVRYSYAVVNSEKSKLQKLDISNFDEEYVLGQYCRVANDVSLYYSDLKYISIDSNIIQPSYFSNMSNLKTVQLNQENIIRDFVVYGGYDQSLPYTEKMIFSDKVKTIGDFAIINMPFIKEVEIGKNVTDIGDKAIGYYGQLNGYDSQSQKRIYKDEGKIKNFKIYCYKDTAGEKYAIDNGFDYELLDAAPKSAKGDPNGDNEINVTDIAVTASHIKGIKPLTDEQQKAADVNNDNELTVTDIAMIAAHIKGIKAIG